MGVTGNILVEWLTLDNDGSTVNSAVDGSGADQRFIWQPPSGKSANINRLIGYVEDQGTFDSGDYGNGLALSSGITVTVEFNDGSSIDLLDGQPITQNGHWARMCYDTAVSTYGTGNEYLSFRWTFAKEGKPIKLEDGEKLVVTIRDDLTGLVSQTFRVGGLYFS